MTPVQTMTDQDTVDRNYSDIGGYGCVPDGIQVFALISRSGN